MLHGNFTLFLLLFITLTHTHTHTHMYIYICPISYIHVHDSNVRTAHYSEVVDRVTDPQYSAIRRQRYTTI